jgi:hypothetical protein
VPQLSAVPLGRLSYGNVVHMLVSSISPKHDSTWFAAKMTQVQFEALAVKCNRTSALNGLSTVPHFINLQLSQSPLNPDIATWAINSWNTENVLRLSRSLFTGDALRTSLQWAFPQAYYSVYSLTQAFLLALGYSDHTHKSVISRFGYLATQGKYPDCLAFTLSSYKPFLKTKLNPIKLRSTTFYDPSDSKVVDSQIYQFLSGTRCEDLSDKKSGMRIKTKKGRPKKGFSKADWIETANKLGPTSLLSLLYRKRIKANYRDIETFFAKNMSPEVVFDSLITIVDSINVVHEAYLFKLIGQQEFERMSVSVRVPQNIFFSQRYAAVLGAAA